MLGEPWQQVNTSRESDQGDARVAERDVEEVHHVVDEGQLRTEMIRSHTAGRVQGKSQIQWSIATCKKWISKCNAGKKQSRKCKIFGRTLKWGKSGLDTHEY